MTRSLEPPAGRLHEVDGRRFFAARAGRGEPPVVFLPGGGVLGLMYLNLHELVGRQTTSVVYDRAGTGWSDPAELPRTATEAAADLRGLLDALGLAGPYILVGHSLGGLHARRFTQMFPEDVAGVVGLEPLYEHWDDHMPQPFRLAGNDADPEVSLEEAAQERALAEEKLADWPAALRDSLLERLLGPDRLRDTMLDRSGRLAAQAAEVREAGPVPDRPLITFTGSGVDPGTPPEFAEAIGAYNTAEHALFDTLAASVTDGRNRLLPGATHGWMHVEAPEAIIAGIDEMIAEVGR